MAKDRAFEVTVKVGDDEVRSFVGAPDKAAARAVIEEREGERRAADPDAPAYKITSVEEVR